MNTVCSPTNLSSDVRDPFYISERINAHNAEIKALYRKFLKQWPDLEGKLTVRIHLHPSGRVVQVEPFESTLQNSEFEDAVLQAIKTWCDFGASTKDKIMIYRQQYLFGE
ncbi:TonB family protein [bacterium]|nr:TonB family protein [bacterium]